MSRLYEALRQMEKENGKTSSIASETAGPVELVTGAIAEPTEVEQTFFGASECASRIAVGCFFGS